MIKSLRLQIATLAVVLAGGARLATAAPIIPYPAPPFVSVQATDPLASEPGNNPGMFTIARNGDTNSALTVTLTLTGTATNGIDYAAMPTNITFAAGQLSSNLAVTPIAEPAATGYKTVILALPRGSFESKEAAPAFIVGGLNRALVYIVYNYTNVPPSVSLVAPTNGAAYLSEPNIVLAATASDSNGWVTAVQFLANGKNIGTVSNHPFDPLPGLPPFPTVPLVMKESHGVVMPALPGLRVNRYQFVWTNVPPGTYALTAVATDNAGLQTSSAAVHITVTTNVPRPYVRIINPANGAEFPDQAPINVFAAAWETNGVVNTVEFFNNTNSLGTETNYLAAEPTGPTPVPGPFRPLWMPFYFRWTNAPVGSNFLTAVVTDNNGTKATSAVVNIVVTTNLFHPRQPWWR